MKVKIPKSRITAPIDFGDAIASRRACGVDLSYTEYDFMQIPSGRVTLFDAFSIAVSFKPLNAECGVVAFPFYCGCMTDVGERVVYAGLRFNEKKAEKWELIYDSSVIAKLIYNPEAASTLISSGVCCLSDSDSYKIYREHLNDDIHPLAGLIVLNGETHDSVEIFGKKFAVFSSGWGDGYFKCFKGVDADGVTTAIIVDFGMIDYCDDGELVEIDANIDYVYDPTKSDKENNIARWTAAVERSSTPEELFDALSRRGYARHSAGDRDGALEDYNAAVNISNSVSDKRLLAHLWSVYDNAAELYIARGEFDAAINIMNAALDAQDDCYAGAYVRLIDLYLLKNEAEKAKNIAERMIDARRDDPTAVMKFAECCVALSDYRAAAEAYGTLAYEFKLYDDLFEQAACLIELSEYDNAELALDKHPAKENFEQYWYYKARIDFERHRYTEAKENAARARGIDAEYLPALKLLVEIHLLLQEYFAVAGYAEEYKRLCPDDIYGYSVCAKAQLMLGNYSECAHNYYYIFDMIAHEERHAALAALSCRLAGYKSRYNRMKKFLKHKRSPYYVGVMCVEVKHRTRSQTYVMRNVVARLKFDEVFLLSLSEFMLAENKFGQAAHVLEALSKSPDFTYEVAAQQVRTAVAVGNKVKAQAFFEHYVAKFVGNIPIEQKQALAKHLGL